MYDAYAAFRELERLFFRGVPERPEPVWERELNAIAPDRQSGRSQLAFEVSQGAVGVRVATIVHWPDGDEIEYASEDPVDAKS